MEEVKVHDLIQVTDEDHGWFACILIVAEIRNNGKGVMAYIPLPDRGPAYIMLAYSEFDVVGCAIVVDQDADDEEPENAVEEERDTEPKRPALN
jgi:hypothetical protein